MTEKVKGKSIKWEKISANYISNKGRVVKVLLKLNNKKINNFKMGKGFK